MSIELTSEQSELLEMETVETAAVLDPRSSKKYRLVPQELFEQYERLLDDSPWTSAERSTLAGMAFSKLDDTDYSHYLSDKP